MKLNAIAITGFAALLSLLLQACSPAKEKSELPAVESPLTVHVDGNSSDWAYEKLAALPSKTFTFDDGSYFDGREVKVVPMAEFWKVADSKGSADVMTAYCTDKYFSVYTREFVETYDPFIIIEVDRNKPSAWTDGLENASPFFISVNFDDSKPPYQDKGHKRPWGVQSVTFGKYDEMFSVFYTGAFAHITGPAAQGRDIWINSCASCHQAPGDGIGGHKAVRPWEILAIHAKMNQEYFVNYVRDPKSLNPAALMEPHSEYDDEEMAALVAFLSTEL